MIRRALLGGLLGMSLMNFGEQGSGYQNQATQVLEAGNTIINKNGVFIYSGTPGFGNLIGSDTPAGVTGDGLGNTVLPGKTEYFNAGGSLGYLAIQIFSGTITFSTSPTAGGVYTQLGAIQDQSANTGLTLSTLNGPVQISSAGTPNPADINIGQGVAGVPGGLVGQIAPVNGFAGNIPLVQTDVTQFNVTTAALSVASKAYPIPPDMSVGTIYRFTNVGFFNIQNAANAPNFQIQVFGQHIPIFTTSGFPIAQLVYWLEARLSFRALGAAGTAALYARLSFSVPGVSTEQTWTAGNNTMTVDTTTASSIEFDFGFGNITGAPNLLSSESSFERISL